MHTFRKNSAIILNVKTPNTLYIVFTNPIVKIPSPKKAASAVFFTFYDYISGATIFKMYAANFENAPIFFVVSGVTSSHIICVSVKSL